MKPAKLTPAQMKKAVEHLKSADPVMKAIIEQVGPPKIPRRDATFAAVARSIAFQQLNGKAATTIFERLLTQCAACNGGDGTKISGIWAAVTPEAILSLSDDQMRAIGFSRAKASYLRDLAEKTRAGVLNFEELPKMSDSSVIEHLTQVKGIGVWSAQMFLMFALHRPDVMPTADFGLNNAIRRAYRKRAMPKPKQVLRVSEPWRPYRTVASWYLWRSLDVKI
ncbi:MAG: DNA-3-methyladenine glycosylase family protein [Terriglobales bacterium]